MNPAHVFLISLAVLVAFWLGVLAESDVSDNDEIGPFVFIPAILLNLAAAGFLAVSIWQLVAQAL